MTDYRTIVADPPWPFRWDGRAGGGRWRNSTRMGYETMAYEAIEQIGVRDRAAANATLLLWVTPDALHGGHGKRVAEAWGFGRRAAEVIWRKPNLGVGSYPRVSHETCVIYVRGSGALKRDRPQNVHSVQTWAQVYGKGNGGKTHSAKPDGFYDFVEAGFSGPYLEMFARRARFGWDYWGDQSLGTAEMEAA